MQPKVSKLYYALWVNLQTGRCSQAVLTKGAITVLNNTGRVQFLVRTLI